mgnify:CR=1 FL=1
MVFEKQKRVRFSHCDPAGIVFYPRYVELFNEVVEDWFADAHGVDFHALHEELRLGIPAVRLEVEYLAPSRYGDLLTFRLEVVEIGNASMRLEITVLGPRPGERGERQASGHADDERLAARVRGHLKIVLTSLDTFRPVAIDGVWRSRFERFLRKG